MGKLALVASLWTSPDLSWLDGPGCTECSLPDASFIIADLKTFIASPPPLQIIRLAAALQNYTRKFVASF